MNNNPEPLVIAAVMAGSLLYYTLTGAGAVMLACWVHNLLFPAPQQQALVATIAEPQEGPRFQVSHVGPYASPTGGYSGALPTGPEGDVPMPSFLYALLISLIGWVASVMAYFVTAFVGGMVLFPVLGRPNQPLPTNLLMGILIVPMLAAMFCAFSLVLSLMIPATYPRALLLGLFSGISLIGILIASFIVLFIGAMFIGLIVNIAR